MKNEISIRGLTINKDNHKVTVYDEEVKLTPIEFDILYLLASNPGKVFSTDEILRRSGTRRSMRPTTPLWYISVVSRGKMKEDERQDKIITTVGG